MDSLQLLDLRYSAVQSNNNEDDDQSKFKAKICQGCSMYVCMKTTVALAFFRGWLLPLVLHSEGHVYFSTSEFNTMESNFWRESGEGGKSAKLLEMQLAHEPEYGIVLNMVSSKKRAIERHTESKSCSSSGGR
jgi:hypothetical protein